MAMQPAMHPELWSVLPPLALRHVATTRVESLDHYVLRLSDVVGLSPATLLDSGLQTGDAASSMKETQWPGLSQRLARRIQAIETLTGQTNLRCGTLWAVSRATNLHGVSQLNLPRRWCPVCYAEQSAASAAEPLVWSMRVLQ
ncbi:Zinc finger protein, partial [mine drainage metagenome]